MWTLKSETTSGVWQIQVGSKALFRAAFKVSMAHILSYTRKSAQPMLMSRSTCDVVQL